MPATNPAVNRGRARLNGRQPRAKTDRLDALKVLSQLFRYEGGEKKAWRVVNVPSVEDEARRHLHRELEDWQALRLQHSNRIKGLLVNMGVTAQVNAAFPQKLEELRMWDGNALPEELKQRLLREFEGWQFADREEGVVPPGAVLVDWKEKVNRHKRKEEPVAAAA